MKPSLTSMISAAVLAAMALAAPVRAETRDAPIVVVPTQSVSQADATLDRVTRERAAVEDTFAAEEKVCSEKFFVNNCLDQSKEKRRVALAQLRAQEVEAEHFKRAASVAKRDADLAERARKDAEEFARREAKPAKPARTEEQLAPRAAPKPGKTLAEREAEHAERLRSDAAETAAGAGERAANVAAFEKKQADVVRRQEQVAKRLEERRAKAAARAAADKKKADAAAAAAAKKQP